MPRRYSVEDIAKLDDPSRLRDLLTEALDSNTRQQERIGELERRCRMPHRRQPSVGISSSRRDSIFSSRIDREVNGDGSNSNNATMNGGMTATVNGHHSRAPSFRSAWDAMSMASQESSPRDDLPPSERVLVLEDLVLRLKGTLASSEERARDAIEAYDRLYDQLNSTQRLELLSVTCEPNLPPLPSEFDQFSRVELLPKVIEAYAAKAAQNVRLKAAGKEAVAQMRDAVERAEKAETELSLAQTTLAEQERRFAERMERYTELKERHDWVLQQHAAVNDQNIELVAENEAYARSAAEKERQRAQVQAERDDVRSDAANVRKRTDELEELTKRLEADNSVLRRQLERATARVEQNEKALVELARNHLDAEEKDPGPAVSRRPVTKNGPSNTHRPWNRPVARHAHGGPSSSRQPSRRGSTTPSRGAYDLDDHPLTATRPYLDESLNTDGGRTRAPFYTPQKASELARPKEPAEPKARTPHNIVPGRPIKGCAPGHARPPSTATMAALRKTPDMTGIPRHLRGANSKLQRRLMSAAERSKVDELRRALDAPRKPHIPDPPPLSAIVAV